MKKLSVLALIVVLLSGCLLQACESAELTFEQALEKLRSANEALQAARLEESQRTFEKSAARGLYFPRIDVTSRFTRIDDPLDIAIAGLGTIPLQDDRFWRASIDFKWPVFTGGRIVAANRAADAFLEEAREKRKRTESVLISELARRYFGLRLAIEVAKVRREVMDGMARHLYEARKLEEQGMIARAEKLHAEVTHAEAERDYKRAVRDVAIARTGLNDILASHEEILPTSPLFLIRKLGRLEDFRNQGLSHNPSLKQREAQREAAHQGYNKELGAMSPEVFLFGVRELYKNDLTMLDPRWAVGVGVSFNLFEGLSGYNRIMAAKTMESKIVRLERDERLAIEALADRRYQQVMKAIEQYDANETARQSAEEYLRVRKRAFEEGYATSLDVVDAQMSLSKVKCERLVALYELDVALAELLETSGQSDKFIDYLFSRDVEVRL